MVVVSCKITVARRSRWREFADHREQRGGAVLFHLDRRQEYIAGAGGEQPFHDMVEMLRVHVVDVGFDDQHLFMLQVGRVRADG